MCPHEIRWFDVLDEFRNPTEYETETSSQRFERQRNERLRDGLRQQDEDEAEDEPFDW